MTICTRHTSIRVVYKFFAFLFFFAASLLGVSVFLWNAFGWPISVVIVALVTGGIIYLTFALAFAASRFLAAKQNLPKLPIVANPVGLILANLALYVLTVGLTLFLLISLASNLLGRFAFPLVIDTILKPTVTSQVKIEADLAKLDDRLATMEFFGRNRYRYDFTDNTHEYRLEFARTEQEASSTAKEYVYYFESRALGSTEWNTVYDTVNISSNETINEMVVTRASFSPLAKPLLIVNLVSPETYYSSDGRGQAFVLYPPTPKADSFYARLTTYGPTKGTTITTAAGTDGLPIITVSYSGWRQGEKERYKLVLDTSESSAEIYPQEL